MGAEMNLDHVVRAHNSGLLQNQENGSPPGRNGRAILQLNCQFSKRNIRKLFAAPVWGLHDCIVELSASAMRRRGGSQNFQVVPRLREYCRQGQAEVVSKSSDKIHATWELPFIQALYMNHNCYALRCRKTGASRLLLPHLSLISALPRTREMTKKFRLFSSPPTEQEKREAGDEDEDDEMGQGERS